MNALAERVLGVAKEYLGPASQQFLSRELRVLACTADTLTPAHLAALAARARVSARRIMDQARADEFAALLADLGSAPTATGQPAVAPLRAAKPDQAPIAVAAQLLAAGKLRQAEAAYRQLAARSGTLAAHQGLARTAVALEDLPAALRALRDGAAALTRSGDRPGAIVLLAEAVALAPGDLAAHRRLAAAHANAGDIAGACLEYARYVDQVIAQGDPRRAWLELAYGRETLGDAPELLRIADRLMPGGSPAAAPTAAGASDHVAATAPVSVAPASVASAPPAIAVVPATVPPATAPTVPLVTESPRTRVTTVPTAFGLVGARTNNPVEASAEPPLDLGARSALRQRWVPDPRPAVDLEALLATMEPSGSPEQAATAADVRATVLIGAHDPRATEATLDAARRLLALRKLQAASDLLLDFVGAGFTDREAQRLLIEVGCGLGRRDVARDKCKLLGAAYRLDGRGETADDVERLAAIL